jgi:hypothetical protein
MTVYRWHSRRGLFLLIFTFAQSKVDIPRFNVIYLGLALFTGVSSVECVYHLGKREFAEIWKPN